MAGNADVMETSMQSTPENASRSDVHETQIKDMCKLNGEKSRGTVKAQKKVRLGGVLSWIFFFREKRAIERFGFPACTKMGSHSFFVLLQKHLPSNLSLLLSSTPHPPCPLYVHPLIIFSSPRRRCLFGSFLSYFCGHMHRLRAR